VLKTLLLAQKREERDFGGVFSVTDEIEKDLGPKWLNRVGVKDDSTKDFERL